VNQIWESICTIHTKIFIQSIRKHVPGNDYWLERQPRSRQTWVRFARRVRPKDFKIWYLQLPYLTCCIKGILYCREPTGKSACWVLEQVA